MNAFKIVVRDQDMAIKTFNFVGQIYKGHIIWQIPICTVQSYEQVFSKELHPLVSWYSFKNNTCSFFILIGT